MYIYVKTLGYNLLVKVIYCLIVVITNYFQDVSSWMVTNWKPLNKNNTFVNRSHYILNCISKDLTVNLDY